MSERQLFSRTHLQTKKKTTFKARPRVEQLEARNLLSAPPTNLLVNNAAEDGTSGAGFTQSETAIVANTSTTPTTLVVGFNDSEEFLPSGSNHFTGWANSADGGSSFTDKDALPASSSGDVGDPVLARDNVSGNIYMATIPFSDIGNQVFKSTDGGSSFASPVTAASSTRSSDKPWIAVDNSTARGRGQGNVYVTFTNFSSFPTSLVFTLSSNDGKSFGKTVTIASGTVQGSNVVVGTDHSIHVFYLNGGSGSAASINVATSTNLGKKFGSPTTVANLVTTGVNGDLGLTVSNTNGSIFRSNTFPQAAVNPVTGDIYVVYDDVGQAAGDKADAYFTMSSNGGSTWSTPVKLNTDGTTTDQWFPSIAVTPDGNHVGVFWYDRRNDTANDSLIDRFGVIGDATSGSVAFHSNFQVTTQSSAPVFGTDGFVNSVYMGDYDQSAADNSNFYTTWGDNRLGTAPDVMFATVPISTFGTGPASLVVTGAAARELPVLPDSASSASGASLALFSGFGQSNSGGLGFVAGLLATPIPAATAHTGSQTPSLDSSRVDQFFAATNSANAALATPSLTTNGAAVSGQVPASSSPATADALALNLFDGRL